jgi:hypothetical protein
MKKHLQTERMCLRLTKPEAQKLRAFAKREKVSISNAIRGILLTEI